MYSQLDIQDVKYYKQIINNFLKSCIIVYCEINLNNRILFFIVDQV